MKKDEEESKSENGSKGDELVQKLTQKLSDMESCYKESSVTLRRTRADNRRLRTIISQYEKNDDITDRVVTIVRNSMESLSPVAPPEKHHPDIDKKEESMLLLLSDVHIGKKTKSYNAKKFIQRLNTLKEGLFDIVDMHRKIRKVDKLYIAFDGDIIDAEAIYPGQSVDGIDAVILDQIYTVGLPAFTSFLQDCSAYFSEIECHCVKGNHGKQNAAKWSSSKSTNWDNVFYKSLEAVFIR